MSGMRLRKYGVQATIDFEVYEVDGVDLRTDWTPAQADCEIMKDGGASTLCDNTATDEGSTYSIVLTATEMQFARGVLKIVDAATKVLLDTVVHIETYGNASAQHAMDFDDAVRGGLTALPAANADAGGGLPISDAGGLDLDAKLANTNEVTAARMAALTDWINGGRLDLLLDAIKVPTDKLTFTTANKVDSRVDNWAGQTVTLSTGNKPDVNIDEISDDATAASNLELFTEILENGTGLIDSGSFKAGAINAAAVAATALDNIVMSDLAQGAPSATASMKTAINYLFEAWRNKAIATATLYTLFKDDGTTALVKSTLADDTTTTSKDEMISGA